MATDQAPGFNPEIHWRMQAADAAIGEAVNKLCTISDLIWRAEISGPDLDSPLCGVDAVWLEAMRKQLGDALTSLQELEAANDAL